MSRPRNQLERGLSHPHRASPQRRSSSSCQVAFCVISLTRVVSETLLQFAGGTKQPGISLFGGRRDGGAWSPRGPCHCRGADTAALALLTPAVIRSAPGHCKSFQLSCRYPPSAEQEKRRPAMPGCSAQHPRPHPPLLSPLAGFITGGQFSVVFI